MNDEKLRGPVFAVQATADECRRMISDLRFATGSFPGPLLASIKPQELSIWLHSHHAPNARTRRLLWLLWVLICRPGQLRTTADIVLSGRNRASLDPASAGKPWSGAGSGEVFGGGMGLGGGI